MFLDVDNPLGAVIGSTTWHKNITFLSHPSLSCRQLTPVSGATKAGAFIFPVSAHPPHLSTEPPSFHKLKVESWATSQWVVGTPLPASAAR